MAAGGFDAVQLVRYADFVEHGAQHLRELQAAHALYDHAQHGGGGGAVGEHHAGLVGNFIGEERGFPVGIGRSVACALLIAGGHPQQIADGHFGQPRMRLRGRLVRKEGDRFIVERELTALDQYAHGAGDEALRAGIEPMAEAFVHGLPVALEDQPVVAQDQQRMQRGLLAGHGADVGLDGAGRNADFLRRAVSERFLFGIHGFITNLPDQCVSIIAHPAPSVKGRSCAFCGIARRAEMCYYRGIFKSNTRRI